jgi:hypothetical protein
MDFSNPVKIRCGKTWSWRTSQKAGIGPIRMFFLIWSFSCGMSGNPLKSRNYIRNITDISYTATNVMMIYLIYPIDFSWFLVIKKTLLDFWLGSRRNMARWALRGLWNVTMSTLSQWLEVRRVRWKSGPPRKWRTHIRPGDVLKQNDTNIYPPISFGNQTWQV